MPALVAMNLIERATIQHFHRHRIGTFGVSSARCVGWRDDDSQRRRFDAIASAAAFAGASVLDVGCGLGDLKGFLDERFEDVSYIGVDHMAPFIRQARERYGHDAGTSFLEGDFGSAAFLEVDYVVASGALSYRCADPGFWRRMIRKMFCSARRGVLFNMLDAAVFPAHPLLVGQDRGEVVAFCRELSRRVTLIDGYLDDDFTVCIHRGRRPFAGATPVIAPLASRGWP